MTPQHLTLAGEEAYPRLGTYAQMNPPIRSGAHRDGLWHWLNQGVPDVIGSDHAPHTQRGEGQALSGAARAACRACRPCCR